MHYFIVNEISLFRLFWRALWGKPTCIIASYSLVRGAATQHLDKIISALHKAGRLKTLEADYPHLIEYPFFGDFIRCTDIFARSEPWMEHRLEFATTNERYGDLAVAYRHSCSNAAFARYEVCYQIHDVLKGDPQAKVIGANAFDVEFYQQNFPESGRSLTAYQGGQSLLNIALALFTTVYSLFWIASRIRPFLAPPQHYLLGFDFISHPTNQYMWDECLQSESDVLLVCRSQQSQKELNTEIGDFDNTAATNGYFPFFGGLLAMGQVIRESATLLRHSYGLPTEFFRRLTALPFRRIMYRGLFNRFHCDFFWGRDDYNPDHALRSIELRRKGGVSLGLMHGIPSIAGCVHQLRHLDFDIYYVQGMYQSEHYYKSRWPAHMKIRAIGSFGLSRAEFHTLAETPKLANVACFLSNTFQVNQTIAALDTIARAFPQRTFYINIKSKEWDTPFGAKLKTFLEGAPENVTVHQGYSYELFFLCDTILSEGSTLAAEAIQFGCASFVFDFHPSKWRVNNYRDFPDACVKSAQQVIDKMRGLEDGSYQFPTAAWAEFIEMRGVIPWDAIRSDIGLNKKEQPLSTLCYAESNEESREYEATQ